MAFIKDLYFKRLKNREFLDTEEIRYDIPTILANSFSYIGMAESGSSTSDTVWHIIRVSYNSNGIPIREQFQSNMSWDLRASGW